LKLSRNTSIKNNHPMLIPSVNILTNKLIIIKNSKRYYSVNNGNNNNNNNNNSESELTPVPILIIKNLNNKDIVKSYKEILKNKGGIYSFLNIENGKQYIGSAKDFYIRLLEHIDNRKSNIALQNAFTLSSTKINLIFVYTNTLLLKVK
jgi:GIY-YIG catalytic domain